MTLKDKLDLIIKTFNKHIVEKEEIIKLSLLGLISGENIFLLGLPGVAKSLISRQLCKLIKDGKYFEYLMNSFSTPEELFGPISLKKLDEDIYERKIQNYLPESNVVFLDEIWKASPAIQNTLLTIINEKIFINGSKKVNVPLNLLITASNELPIENEGLEALFDRFLIRAIVNPIKEKDNFYMLLNSQKNLSIDFDEQLKFSIDEINSFETHINKVSIDNKILDFILEYKTLLEKEFENNSLYVSDRRWKKIAWVLKAIAFANNRNYVDAFDILIIKQLVWSKPEQIDQINVLFDNVYNVNILNIIGLDFNNIFNAIDKIQQEIQVNSNVIKSAKIIDKQINSYSNSSYIEFISNSTNAPKRYLLPIEIRKDNWNNAIYYPNTKNLQTAFYYELIDNNWIQKNFESQHFKLINSDSKLYEFNGINISPVLNNIVLLEQTRLNNLKVSINELNIKLANVNNNIDKTINQIKNNTNVLINNIDFYNAKLINLITHSHTKAKTSIESLSKQINEINNNVLNNKNER